MCVCINKQYKRFIGRLENDYNVRNGFLPTTTFSAHILSACAVLKYNI